MNLYAQGKKLKMPELKHTTKDIETLNLDKSDRRSFSSAKKPYGPIKGLASHRNRN
jgi:hypothetical protein